MKELPEHFESSEGDKSETHREPTESTAAERMSMLFNVRDSIDNREHHKNVDNDRRAADAVGAIHGKRLSSIELFQGENWTERTRSEREAGLVQAERLLSAEQGRNPVKVHFEVMDEGQYGYYDGEIHVRSSDVDASTPDEALNTIAHEGRHAYQDYCIDNPDTHTNQEQVTRWAENALPGHYKVPGDVSNGNIVTQAEYEEQPLEADAWSYGNAVARTVASQQTR